MWTRCWTCAAGASLVAALVACAQIRTERDVSQHYTWAKRGESFGELVHVFCTLGSDRERAWFSEAATSRAYPARVTIECPRTQAP